MSDYKDRDFLKIKLASPETILKWSYGEVKKSETVNYRTYKPEKDGLFCEAIFGPTKNYQCSVGCGKYKKAKDEGVICDECGVEVTHSRVRRERMGHIKLATPIVHFWYFKKQNYISQLLNMKPKDVEAVIYCKNYVIIDPGSAPLEKKQVVTDKQYAQIYDEFGEEVVIDIGGRAIKYLLEEIDLDALSMELQIELSQIKTQKREDIKKRLSVVEDFRKSGNKPSWMVLDVLPVLPADLRPLVQLDGGRFATSDLNELYRRILNRNNRLIKLLEMGAPSIIVENELRMLQASVDALIANQNRPNPVVGPGKRVLKSLSSYLEGKTGRFRQNLLGKRVDYSGRSVITVGPELELHQCGIPRDMALELFKPFVMREMVNLGYVETFKQAKRRIETRHDKMWDVLEKIVEHHPVILNRAPTLHKLSIRAFEPKIIEGKSIQLHPLVCSGFNADFDGDTMSIHIPISREAQAEARTLLLATKNLQHPQNGKSAVTPSQDMVLGCYYLSIEEKDAKGEGKYFTTEEDVYSSYENGFITLHTKIILNVSTDKRFNGKKYIVTTPGKLIFNSGFPEGFSFVNEGIVDLENTEGLFDSIEEAKAYLPVKPNNRFGKSFLEDFLTQVYLIIGDSKTAKLLDNIKEKGFTYSTKAGFTISLDDVKIPPTKWDIVKKAEKEMEKIEEMYQYGRISREDRYEFVTKKWEKVSGEVADASVEWLEKNQSNPILMMIDSGARGSKNQYRQMAAMRGHMAEPSGRTIERPVLSNFKEGLDVYDYFTSSHGARKGMADTSLKTADSGYLTRRLVDVAHDVVVNEDDCGTKDYFMVSGVSNVEKLEERILGRVLGKEIEVDGVVYPQNTLINNKVAKVLISKLTEVPIRSLLTCKSEHGICKKCYGNDLTNNKEVEKGEAVGVIAAQSIGEPGTQLTMRTFHSGGVAGGDDITQGLPRIQEIFEARDKIKGEAVLSREEGVVNIVEKGRLKDIVVTLETGEVKVYHLGLGAAVTVEDGETITVGKQLTKGSINAHQLLELRGMEEVQKYLVEEVQRVYRGQGVKINDKHVEVIVRQMTKRVRVIETGDSSETIGSIIDKVYADKINEQLVLEDKEPVEYRPLLLGITKASLSTESFLSAASFQETPKVLTEAAVKGKKDYIIGLKEAVILGRNIPAGTGFHEYVKK